MSLFGPPDVEKLKAKGDIKGLITALAYQKDRELRDRAAEALGEIGDAPAVEPLIAALGDQNEDVRVAAVVALGSIGAPAVEPLIAALGDQSWFVRSLAARALSEFGDALSGTLEHRAPRLGAILWRGHRRRLTGDCRQVLGASTPREDLDGQRGWASCIQVGCFPTHSSFPSSCRYIRWSAPFRWVHPDASRGAP